MAQFWHKNEDKMNVCPRGVNDSNIVGLDRLAQSRASLTVNQGVVGSSRGLATFVRWDLAMKKILRPFSPFRWFKKGCCQLLSKKKMGTKYL